MEHELPWFEKRKNMEIVMDTPYQRSVNVLAKTDNEVFYYYNLQKKGFTFKEL